MSDENRTMLGIRSNHLLPGMALLICAAGYAQHSQAGATFKIDDTKWVSIGAGLRTTRCSSF